MKVKRKSKKVVSWLILAAVLIAGATCLILRNKGNNYNKNKETDFYPDSTNRGNYIDILTEDCSLYIGTALTLKCEANPESALENVFWSTSDSAIVSVDDNGKAIVVGVGTAVITATSDMLTDSVVIIGIEKEAQTVEGETVTEPALPIFIPNEKGELVPENPTEPETEGKTDSDIPVKPTREPSTYEVPTLEKPTRVEKPTEAPTKAPEKPTQAVTVPTEPDVDYQAVLMSSLSSLGYTKYKEGLDYVFIYKEDGNYLGEVIINDSFVQIYIQTRTTGFDEAIKALISLVVPEDYNKVFSAFVGASDNKTIKVQNHTIRIRPASGENHAQLIISY